MSELKSCPLTTDEAIGVLRGLKLMVGTVANEALDIAISALRRAQPASETLTLEQLRDMGGEPVWCVYPGCSTGGEWFLVNSQGACKNCSFLNFRYYGEWLAYRRKPERSENG